MEQILKTLSTREYVHKINYNDILYKSISHNDSELAHNIISECKININITVYYFLIKHKNTLNIFLSKNYTNYKKFTKYVLQFKNAYNTGTKVYQIICNHTYYLVYFCTCIISILKNLYKVVLV